MKSPISSNSSPTPPRTPTCAALAEEELPRLKTQLAEAETNLRLALLPRDAADEKGAILEIRAGTGGDEAALFAGDLFRMYQKYAEKRGWTMELISASEGTMGGFKEIIAQVSGKGVFARLKFESGTHRVQRVPTTETQGRIHTSAATVAVLPEAAEVDHAHRRRRSAHRHHARRRRRRPACQQDRIGDPHHPYSQRNCGDDAGGALAAPQQGQGHGYPALAAVSTSKGRSSTTRARPTARSQVGSGDRSERIRTYNFPQGRVSDHRINLTLYKIDKVMEGEALDEILDP